MTRLPRFVIPGQPQHIILRGNNRTEIFCAEADYRFYLKTIGDRPRFLRCVTNGNYALGNERFQQEIEAALGRRAKRGQAGRPSKIARVDVFQGEPS